jgi:predicted ATPase
MRGILSFRDASVELRPLNVLIGPNASGKSNLIEVISLLQAVPRDLPAAIRKAGGVAEWVWKGEGETPTQGIEAVVHNPDEPRFPLDYMLEIGWLGVSVFVLHERLTRRGPRGGLELFNVGGLDGGAMGDIRPKGTRGAGRPRRLQLAPGQSVLGERRDPDQYPEITSLAKRFDAIRLYREWNLGPGTPVRRPQPADLPNDFLEEDASNLTLVLNRMERDRSLGRVEEEMRRFYGEFEALKFIVEAGTAQLFVREKGLHGLMPATRLSDGTLRYVCLLAILCHPNPPPLVCIEEPELGLHPDILPDVARLLREASERAQLIVTTHSEILVDAFSDEPDGVVVCERDFDGQTQFRRLSKDDLSVWLEDYRLGELWAKGEIGGKKW